MKYNRNDRLIPVKVYLTHDEYSELKNIAQEQDVSISYVGRTWLNKGINKYKHKQQ